MKSLFSKIYLFAATVLLVFGCTAEAGLSDAGISETGVGGSYARFMIVGDFMYVVDNQNIQTFSLADPVSPALTDSQLIGERIESIFSLGNRLFIGSGTGLYIYTIGNDGIPERTSEFSYDVFPIRPCDPVVATDSFAYVTLNTTTGFSPCGGFQDVQLNQLTIFDVTNIEDPVLIAEHPMVHPKGVGIDGKTLFLCDDEAGLKIFDVTNPLELQAIAEFPQFTAFDVIPLDGLLLMVGPDNVYQFDYTDLMDVKLISKIPIQP